MSIDLRQAIFYCVAILCASLQGISQENYYQGKFEQLDYLLPNPNSYRTGSGAPGKEYWQQRADYEIDVILDDRNQSITGSEKITYYNQSHDELNYLWLQLDQNVRAKGSDSFTANPNNQEFEYYAKRFGLEEVKYQLGVVSKKNWDKYIDDLRALRGNDRVWILFSHVHKKSGVDEEKFFLFVLNSMGTQVESFKRTGASVYLYELPSNSTQ